MMKSNSLVQPHKYERTPTSEVITSSYINVHTHYRYI